MRTAEAHPTDPASGAAPKGRISVLTATSISVANMVGTGVFTSLGFQVLDIRSGFALLLLWTIGGLFALAGALCYAELAGALPRSGGEYHFLSRSIHPGAGFLAGWVSVTVGFAPPIALAAFAFGDYFARVVPGAPPLLLSCGVVAVVTLVHLKDLRLGSLFQNVFTALKIALILVFIASPWLTDARSDIRFAPAREDFSTVLSAPFGVALLFVMFAYSGWNAATYVVSEVKEPEKNVPRALFRGTLLVMGLYVAVHWAFLVTTPIEALAGKIEVGHVVAERVFGAGGGRIMSSILCLALVSTISAMTWAGPRVTQVMGQDWSVFRALAKTNAAGIPVRAILLQTAIVVVLLLTSTFDKVLVYVQFVLVASSGLTVVGVMVLRRRRPELERPYRVWGYPVTPLLFLALSLATMVYTLNDRPWESLAGSATVLLGLPLYWWSSRREGSAGPGTTL